MRRGVAILAVLIAAASAAAPARAQYEDPVAEPPTVERWRVLARDIARPWPSIQERSGRLPDYMDERYGSRYGDATMGYGLIRTGLREGDRPMIRAGMRAITFAVRRPRVQSSFENFAVAAAYHLARTRASKYADFRRARHEWERWMARSRTTRVQKPTTEFGNHWLIDALAVLELRRAGVRSPASSAASLRLARRLINSRVPGRIGGGGRRLLSDPPDEPVSYHGLSVGFYARAVQLLGRGASRSARSTLRRIARTASLVTAPDGDTAYWGRSMQHVWSPAGTAFAAEAASVQPGASRSERAVNRAVAERTLARVARDHPVGPRGQWIVPSLAQDFAAGRRSLEGYAGGPSMSGLALAMINWTLDTQPAARKASRLPADRSTSAVLSRGRGRFAVVRRGRVWFAVKASHALRDYSRDDLRYASGLVNAKMRGRDGAWFDLVPHRPPLAGRPPVTTGPVLAGGGHPSGERLALRRGGRVEVRGAYRTRGGRALRRASWAYTPVDCGVRMTFRARAGDRYSLTAFFRSGRPRVGSKSASDGQQRVTVTPAPGSMRIAERTVASARDAHLHRLDIRVRTKRAREVRVTYCG